MRVCSPSSEQVAGLTVVQSPKLWVWDGSLLSVPGMELVEPASGVELSGRLLGKDPVEPVLGAEASESLLGKDPVEPELEEEPAELLSG